MLYREMMAITCQISIKHVCILSTLNQVGPELFFLNLAHPVYKMWIIQEPNMLELWNKLHSEEEKSESIYHV